MTVLYDPESSSAFYKEYYQRQHGNGLSVYRGATVQRGRGIGNFFSKALRGAMPLLRSGAKSVGKQLLASGAETLKDIVSGRDPRRSAVENFSEGGKQLLDSLVGKLARKPVRKRKKRKTNISGGGKKRKVKGTPNIFT